jgi:hypothetical protein
VAGCRRSSPRWRRPDSDPLIVTARPPAVERDDGHTHGRSEALHGVQHQQADAPGGRGQRRTVRERTRRQDEAGRGTVVSMTAPEYEFEDAAKITSTPM